MKSVGDIQTRTSCLRLIGARIEMENFSIELQSYDKKLHNEINLRLGVLEKWRHVLSGGSIVIGFLLHKFIDFT